MQARTSVKAGWTRYYMPINLETRLEMESALFAARLFDTGKLHSRLIRQSRLMDEDVLTLMGFQLADENVAGTPAQLRKALAWQREHLECNLGAQPSRQTRNLQKLCGYLHFNQTEAMAVHLGLMLAQSSAFSDLIRIAGKSFSCQAICGLFARALGVMPGELRAVLRENSRPARMQLIELGSMGLEALPTVPDQIRTALDFDDFSEQRLLRHLVRRAPQPRLAMSDYAHVPQLRPLLSYLEDATANGCKGVNILLYGPPGTGKTELARTVAECLDCQLYEVPNEDEKGGVTSGRNRFGAYLLSQQVLATQQHTLLLFDEAEDVFGVDGLALDGERHGTHVRGKSWINEQLETNSAPTVWTCNEISAFDSAHLRRFDFVIEMDTPPRSVRRRIVERYFGRSHVSPQCMDQLAAIEQLSPGIMERSARVVQVLDAGDPAECDAHARRQIQDTLRAMGICRTLPEVPLPSHYDLAFTNADIDLRELVACLRMRGSARLCLYGPPGTGKTAFAHHLGERLDLPVMVRRASDLLGCYLGESEKNIAGAFARASQEHALLVIDEADSFLRDRTGAVHGWEVTTVNEFLTQMESFDGIFVASTNLMDQLDPASSRRFDFKVRLDYLRPTQRHALLARACGVELQAVAASLLQSLDRMDKLTPGDMASVLRQLTVLGEEPSPARVIDRLAAEMALKPGAARRPIGFIH